MKCWILIDIPRAGGRQARVCQAAMGPSLHDKINKHIAAGALQKDSVGGAMGGDGGKRRGQQSLTKLPGGMAPIKTGPRHFSGSGSFDMKRLQDEQEAKRWREREREDLEFLTREREREREQSQAPPKRQRRPESHEVLRRNLSGGGGSGSRTVGQPAAPRGHDDDPIDVDESDEGEAQSCTRGAGLTPGRVSQLSVQGGQQRSQQPAPPQPPKRKKALPDQTYDPSVRPPRWAL